MNSMEYPNSLNRGEGIHWNKQSTEADRTDTMAKLDTLGITIAMTEANIARVRETFPDIEVIIEKDLDKAPEAMTDVDALVGRARHVSLMVDSANLRWMQTLTAGADAIPIDEVNERNIVITNGSGIHAPNLAEHILGFMLAFARGFPTLMRRQASHDWNQDLQQFELNGQTLCVVGLGDIGLALAEKASAIGMTVTGVRRRSLDGPSFLHEVAQLDSMEPLLRNADHVAITLPLTSSTQQLFDRNVLQSMKSGAYLYNVGRGEIIDQDALIDLLKSGSIAGAGLDVTTPEPLPSEHQLWDLPNVMITSHTGGRSPRRLDRFTDLLIDNISRYRSDRPLRNIVDLEAGY
jgi:phosphoglycerate dehydrogenase-like enzyme